ncbi:Protein of unknown function, partial [Gryllus bimaculatus]
MAKLLMMSELSGDVLTHRSRRCFSVYSLSSLQHGDLKMNEAEVLAKKYSVDDHQNEDSDLGSNSSMESSRPVQHNTVRGLVLLAALAVLVAVVFAFPQREENNSGCSDDHFCDDQNLCAHACSQCPADVHVIVYLYYTCKLTKMLRFVLLVSVAATATAFPQRFEEKNIPFGILKMHMKINRSHKKKLVSKIVFNSSVPENIFLINQ